MVSELFPLDQARNDELLIDQERRKQDLIDYATRRFNPRLTGDADVQVIHLYSTNATLRRYVRDTFKAAKVIVVEHCGAGKERKDINEIQYDGVFIPLPNTADMVVTKANLNTKVEWMAARLRAMPVVLPEAEEYVRARLKKQRLIVLVGGDQAK